MHNVTNLKSETSAPNGISAVDGVDESGADVVDQRQPILSAVEGVEAGTKIKYISWCHQCTKNVHCTKKQDYTSKSGRQA